MRREEKRKPTRHRQEEKRNLQDTAISVLTSYNHKCQSNTFQLQQDKKADFEEINTAPT